jgi:hypothetical protein
VNESSVLDGALDSLLGTADEFGGGLSNHGPMVVESLLHLGHADAVAPWLANYSPQLEPLTTLQPPPVAAADLAAVLEELLPGSVGAATHGLLRTAHALRGLATHGTSPQRWRELERGINYWRLSAEPLPAIAPCGSLDHANAISEVPRTPPSGVFFISNRLREVDLAALTPHLQAARAFIDPDDGLRTVALTALQTLVANPGRFIAFVHAVTSTAMTRYVVAAVGDHVAADAAARQWTILGALWSAYGEHAPVELSSVSESIAPSWSQLSERAIANGDEHVVKLISATADIAATATADYDRTTRALLGSLVVFA